MTVYVKQGGSWKEVAELKVKVGGTWRTVSECYVKVNGVWRQVPLTPPVPAGLIVPYSGSTIPEGWTEYTLANNRYIMGASSDIPPESSGGSSTNLNLTSSIQGEHTGTSRTYGAKSGGTGRDSGGSHSHIISLSYVPPYQSYRFIEATTHQSHLPANSIVLSYGVDLPGLTKLNVNNRFLRGGSVGSGGYSGPITGETSIDGLHNHNTTLGRYTSDSTGTYTAAASGSHSHTFEATITENIKKALVFAYTASASFVPPQSCIAFWKSLTPPPGWALCDGTNGTPDLRKYFLYIVTSNAGSKTGDNTISVQITIGANSWDHSHDDEWKTSMATSSGQHKSASFTHSHNVQTVLSFVPPYLALAIIMKK